MVAEPHNKGLYDQSHASDKDCEGYRRKNELKDNFNCKMAKGHASNVFK